MSILSVKKMKITIRTSKARKVAKALGLILYNKEFPGFSRSACRDCKEHLRAGRNPKNGHIIAFCPRCEKISYTLIASNYDLVKLLPDDD
jgi:hypothetical protein